MFFLFFFPVRLCYTHTDTHARTQNKYKMGRKIWAMKPAPCYIDKQKKEEHQRHAMHARLKRNTDQKSIRWVVIFEGFFFLSSTSAQGCSNRRRQNSPFPPEKASPSHRCNPSQRTPHNLALRQDLKDAHARHLLLHPPEDEPAGRRSRLLEHLLHRRRPRGRRWRKRREAR